MVIRIACHGQRGPCRVAPAHELFCIKAVPRGFSAQPEQEEDVVPSAHFATPVGVPTPQEFPQGAVAALWGAAIGSTEGSLR